MHTTSERDQAETLVAAALMKAFSAEVTPECRIMLGKYSRQIRFMKQDYRIIQMAFDLNITSDAVYDPDLIWKTAELMGAECEYLFNIYILTEELYHAIVYLTGAVFDLGEITERVAIRDGD